MGGHPACPQVLFGNKRRKHINAQLAGKLDNQSRFTINPSSPATSGQRTSRKSQSRFIGNRLLTQCVYAT